MSRPISRIQELYVSVSLVDSAGRIAATAPLGPFGTPDASNIADVLVTPDELLARVAAMCHTNGAPPEVLHNIIQEGIERSRSWMQAHGFTPAVPAAAGAAGIVIARA